MVHRLTMGHPLGLMGHTLGLALALGLGLATPAFSQFGGHFLDRYKTAEGYDWDRVSRDAPFKRASLTELKVVIARDRVVEAYRAGEQKVLLIGLIQEIDVRLAEIDRKGGNAWWDRLAGFRDPFTREVNYRRVLEASVLNEIKTWQGAEVVLRQAVERVESSSQSLQTAEGRQEAQRDATLLRTLLVRTAPHWKGMSWVEAQVAEAVDRARNQLPPTDPTRQSLETLRETVTAGMPARPSLTRSAEAVELGQSSSYDWAKIARHGVVIQTRSQATAALEAGAAEFERLARTGGPESTKQLRTVTEALHELRYAVREHGWRFEWVELTYEPRLRALKSSLQESTRGGQASFVQQLERLSWISNELPAWIHDRVVEESTRKVMERGGPKANAYAKVHPGLVASATYFPEGEMFGESGVREITFGQGFVNQVYEASREVPRAQRALFQQQVFAFMAARVAVHLNGGTGDVDTLVREATQAEVLPEAKRLGTQAELELDRRGTISRDGRRVLAEDPVKRVQRESYERKVNKAMADLDAVYRKADGRLRWAAWSGQAAAEFGSGFGKFLLAVFLKELAAGLVEGDGTKIQELYEQMANFGLFKEYGLFMAGAATGEVVYRRFLEKHMAKRAPMLGGVVRSNLALATGLALPRLVRGEGLDEGYVVSLASLGLSAAAVEAALGAVPGVRKLRAASRLAGASRMFKFGGWVYQGVELALVLTIGEQVEHWWIARAERADMLDALEASAQRLIDAPEGEAEEALDDYLARWDDWRSFLLKPAVEAKAKFDQRLDRASRQAKLEADQAAKASELAARFSNLPLAEFARRAGTSEGVADEFSEAGQAYQDDLQEALDGTYQGERRRTHFLDGLADAARGADTVGEGFSQAHQEASENRLQTYEDQKAALTYVAEARGSDAGSIELAQRLVEKMESLDFGLFGPKGGGLQHADVPLPTTGPGTTGVLKDSLKGE